MAVNKPTNSFMQDHDPDDELDYMFRFRITAGESIVSATVTVVDPKMGEPPTVPTDLIISDISFGVIPNNIGYEDSNIWGVTFWVTSGTPGISYYLRCQITTDSSPNARLLTKTMRLLCQDQ